MLTYEQFEGYLSTFLSQRDESEKFCDKIEELFPGATETFYFLDYQELFLALFSDMVDDSEGWINYFVYEKNCKWFEVYISDNEGTTTEREEVIQIDSPLKLYNLITGKI